MKKAAIIGVGCAGYHGIVSLRENGWTGEIHAYTDISHPTANPMLTTYYVSGKLPYDAMFPFESNEDFCNKYNVTLHLDTKVTHINASAKEVILSDGTSDTYDQILISTGARAIAPPLGQKNNKNCFLMRSVKDAQALQKRLQSGNIQSALVVGASMVGIKITELLVNKGIKVTMADMAGRLFPLACMKETADVLEKDLEGRGVTLLLKKGVNHINEEGSTVKTTLSDGQLVESDIIILCIGTRANTELAANTEIIEEEPITINRGIVVDTHMQTNIEGIYAAGDCCESLNLQTGNTQIIGLWANAAIQGRIAGCCMAGKPAGYTGSIPNNITHYFDQIFVGIGDPNLEGERIVCSNHEGIISAIYEDSKIKCINILGNYRISGMVKDYLIRQITGNGEAMTVKDMGMLRISGIPEVFINLLGGLHD